MSKKSKNKSMKVTFKTKKYVLKDEKLKSYSGRIYKEYDKKVFNNVKNKILERENNDRENFLFDIWKMQCENQSLKDQLNLFISHFFYYMSLIQQHHVSINIKDAETWISKNKHKLIFNELKNPNIKNQIYSYRIACDN